MCGIPGWVSLGLDLNREQPTLDEMTETMACREPAVPGSTSGTASTRSATGGSPDTSRRSTNSAASQLCRSVIRWARTGLDAMSGAAVRVGVGTRFYYDGEVSRSWRCCRVRLCIYRTSDRLRRTRTTRGRGCSRPAVRTQLAIRLCAAALSCQALDGICLLGIASRSWPHCGYLATFFRCIATILPFSSGSMSSERRFREMGRIPKSPSR